MIPTLVEGERMHILEALKECRGVMKTAAKQLGMSPSALLTRMRRHNITRGEISDLILSAVKDGEDKTFIGRKLLTEEAQQKRIDVLRRNQGEQKIYGSIGYIAKYVFRGDDKMVSYARLVAEDGDTRFQAFVEAWDKEQESPLPYGARKGLFSLINECGINSIDFCAEVLRACMKRNIDISGMFAGLAHPKVVQTNIKQALKSKGVRDREMFLQHSGWLPVPKGSVITVNAQAAAGAVAQTGGNGKGEATPLPDFEEMTVEGSKIVRQEFEEQE